MGALEDRRARLLGALYRTFGASAQLTPAGGGAATPVTVRRPRDDEADEIISFGQTKAVQGANILRVRTSEVPVLAKGAQFALASITLQVIAQPRHTEHALEWRFEAKPV